MTEHNDATSTAGWHQDANDPTITRYWDGSSWTAERHWDGSSWVDRTAAPVPVAATSAAATPVAASPTTEAGPTKRLSGTAMTLFGGAAVAAVGVMLPWDQVTSNYAGTVAEQSPNDVGGGAALLLIALAAGAAACAWPIREKALTKGRLLGLAAITAVMTFFSLAKLNAITDAEESMQASQADSSDVFAAFDTGIEVHYTAGLGLMLWTAGVVALWVGIVMAYRARSKAKAKTA
jgi:hypothetical protein